MHAYDAWVGRTETVTDTISPAAAAALAATLDVEPPADALPPLWHWVYFTPKPPASEIGPDGHARRGGFLPPVALPRRLWAGGRLEWHAPLAIGDRATRTSRVVSIEAKQGRSGALVFVTVRHEIAGREGLAIAEEHDIVYRGAPQPGDGASAAAPVPDDAAFTRDAVADTVLLFRYSALTFNGHRIHYDRTYATEVEGYPGLVVHGPLLATLLVELARRERPAARARRFAFKALHPVFDGQRFRLCGRDDGAGSFALWVRDRAGRLAMQASLHFEP